MPAQSVYLQTEIIVSNANISSAAEVVSFTLISGYTTTNTNWLVCVKNLAENGYLVAVHPSGWRNVEGKFKYVQLALREREIQYINIVVSMFVKTRAMNVQR